ncbi:MAG: hypothetical protein A3K03_04845 [Bdellovibrionales bacterium RIFOXYD1_FULL_44_7]|nr:MAG: hypothetical protein A3K03_04845 [Bdellovibrionales bacterium RIFOXYD1_FULL_44_7]
MSRFVRDDKGQATVEYILLLSVTAVAAGALSRAILSTIDKGILRFGGQLEKDLKTGRTPVTIWKN